jgi:putative MFS transporter
VEELGSRIDALPKIPLKRWVIIAISLASFMTYYDITNFSYISPILKTQWSIGDTEIAYGASMTLLGYVIGAIFITILADYYGRRPAFIISIMVLAMGSTLTAISEDITQMAIFRLITGIGVGSEIAIVGAYIGEMSPRSRRGKYTSIITLIGWLGLAFSGPLSFMLVQNDHIIGIESWRIVMGIPGLIGIILLPFRIHMPESLRWLLAKGKIYETNSLLVSLGVAPLEIKTKIVYSPKKINLQIFRNRRIFFKILFLVSVWSLVLIPIYASLLLVVEYVNQGFSLNESISINTLSSIGFVAGGLVSILMADRIERKYQVAIASIVMSCGFILRGFLIENYDGLVVAGFIAFASNAWLISSLLVYTSESFPTEIRSFSAGTVEGISRGLAAIGPIIFVLVRPLGFFNLMVVIASFSVIATAMMIAYGSNTAGKSLEQISKEDL